MANSFIYNSVEIAVGDTIRLHQRIVEEKKTRTQIFEGTIIAVSGRENGKTFVVRKIGANSIGIEKIVPINMPSIEKIEVKRKGQVNRSKLYYLRDRIGKAASKIKEKATDYAAKAAA